MHFKVSSDNIRILDEFSDLFSHEINVFLVDLYCPESEEAIEK